MGPTSDFGEVYLFEQPAFSDKEFCKQFVIEKSNELNTYLSKQWKTLPDVYANKFYCMTINEVDAAIRRAGRAAGRKISI